MDKRPVVPQSGRNNEGRRSALSQSSSSDDDTDSIGTSRSHLSLTPRTVLPKALPDLDDVAMSHVFHYIQLSERDLYWSFLSDSFFIVGGVLYVVLSVWDVLQQQTHTLIYQAINIMAPGVYVLNSVVDVMWAYQIKQRLGAKKAVTDTWNDWRLLLDLDDDSQQDHTADYTCRTWYYRLRKHSAHRRTIIAAFTFGFAALFGLISVLVGESNVQAAAVLDAVSVYGYIVSAIFACSGKRTRPWLQGNGLRIYDDPERMEDLGDLLFLVGSFVDVVLSMFQFDDGNPGWEILSSFLWCLDACFYLRSDCVMRERLNHQHLHGSGTLV